jgi:hypothetical protein
VDHDSRLPPRTDRDEQVTGNLSGGDRCPNGQLEELVRACNQPRSERDYEQLVMRFARNKALAKIGEMSALEEAPAKKRRKPKIDVGEPLRERVREGAAGVRGGGRLR